jgi:RNA polymerase sigma-70 factor (ECF subfamily)
MTGRDPMPVTGLTGLETPPVARPAAGRWRDDSVLAAQVRALVAGGDLAAARERFADIVRKQQRRASQIAFHYLRDAAEADEATQDAFVKAFFHIESFRPEHSFEVWFTRILVNGCLDRKRARARRERWLLPVLDSHQGELGVLDVAASPSANPEQTLIAQEQRAEIAAAVRRLPPQQRTVFLLCAYGGHSTREAAAITDLSESTVRVHLFRAVRKLRVALKAGRYVDDQTR